MQHNTTTATSNITSQPLKSELLNYLRDRGFLYQASDLQELDKLLCSQKITAYIGFDCTADNLHVGSLLQIMLLRALKKFGHTGVVLMGGGTTLIGDPSGKDTSRSMITEEQISKNQMGIRSVIHKFLENSDTLFVDNASWLKDFNYIKFLREYGSLFTINRMLTFDSVKLRLERQQPLSFLEFNYMLLQAIDFLHLYKTHGVLLQLGGSDQWGNIINGIELVRRCEKAKVYGLTSPLITNSDGSKMGKTAAGAVWLNETEGYTYWDYYQFWRNTPDEKTIPFLKLFTELPLEEIEKLSKLIGKELSQAKKILAYETTALCFGETAAQSAQELATEVFESKNTNTKCLPTLVLNKEAFSTGALLLTNLLTLVNLTRSSSEGRRLILNRGIKINGEVVEDPKFNLELNDLLNPKKPTTIAIGKKHHYQLIVE